MYTRIAIGSVILAFILSATALMGAFAPVICRLTAQGLEVPPEACRTSFVTALISSGAFSMLTVLVSVIALILAAYGLRRQAKSRIMWAVFSVVAFWALANAVTAAWIRVLMTHLTA